MEVSSYVADHGGGGAQAVAQQVHLPRWRLVQLYEQQGDDGMILTDFPSGSPMPPTRYRLLRGPGEVWQMISDGNFDTVL